MSVLVLSGLAGGASGVGVPASAMSVYGDVQGRAGGGIQVKSVPVMV